MPWINIKYKCKIERQRDFITDSSVWSFDVSKIANLMLFGCSCCCFLPIQCTREEEMKIKKTFKNKSYAILSNEFDWLLKIIWFFWKIKKIKVLRNYTLCQHLSISFLSTQVVKVQRSIKHMHTDETKVFLCGLMSYRTYRIYYTVASCYECVYDFHTVFYCELFAKIDFIELIILDTKKCNRLSNYWNG